MKHILLTAKPRGVICESMWSTNGYHVDCKVKHIFPEAMVKIHFSLSNIILK